MHAPRLTLDSFAPVRPAILALLLLALGGCASGLATRPGASQPYVGVFTGDFVDGLPLYRFPAIEVIGSRR